MRQVRVRLDAARDDQLLACIDGALRLRTVLG
jgi:hypothetical protein